MESLTISCITFVCVFGGALLGWIVRAWLPDQHATAETKEVVKQVMGIVAAMTGMVLGLLVASAKSSFDEQRDGIARLAANIVVLDRLLEHYGTEAREARAVLRKSATDMLHRIWPAEFSGESEAEGQGRYDELYDRVLALQPKNDAQRTIHAQAVKVIHETTEMRWRLHSQRSSSIPIVFLALLVAWLTITFSSYALFAPRHTTTVSAIAVGALVVSSAVFLILELDHSLGGLIHISSQPLQNAIAEISR